MNTYTIKSGNTTFTRISKARARKWWGITGKAIALCPVKLRPGYPWAPHCTMLPEQQIQQSFDGAVNSFEYYNCADNETGLYTAFYIVTQS